MKIKGKLASENREWMLNECDDDEQKKKKSWERRVERVKSLIVLDSFTRLGIYLFSQSVIKSHTNEHTDAAKECKLKPSIDSRRKS